MFGGRFKDRWPTKPSSGNTPPSPSPQVPRKFGIIDNANANAHQGTHPSSSGPIQKRAVRDNLKPTEVGVHSQELYDATTIKDPLAGVDAALGASPATGAKSSTILVSAVLSIHNRGKLFKRALDSYLWQTIPPAWWEIVLVDDMSTEDLSKTYAHLAGKINLRHIKIDHTVHPYFIRKNPGWKLGFPKIWYHTPAISINVGCAAALAPVICLCHPEILHAPTNFEIAVRRLARERAYLFGTSYLGTPVINEWLNENDAWTAEGWHEFLSRVRADRLQFYGHDCYWYTSFIPKAAVEAARGVDFEYLNGVAGEDDDFRERVRLAGWNPIYDPGLEGFHQDHSDEKEKHRRRDSKEWQTGLVVNRKTYASRKLDGFPVKANQKDDWMAADCVVSETRFRVGSKVSETIAGPAYGNSVRPKRRFAPKWNAFRFLKNILGRGRS